MRFESRSASRELHRERTDKVSVPSLLVIQFEACVVHSRYVDYCYIRS
jgi:hypothetical protein